MKQETFEDPVGAYEFGDLVDQIGGEAARMVLERRRASLEATPTLREFTATYLDKKSGILTGIEDGTRKGYERAAELSFLRILGALPIDAIDRQDVGRWLAWQEEQPSTRSSTGKVSAKTVKNYHGLLSSILKAAVAQKLRDDNPAFKMRLSQGVKREAVFLSPAEFRTLLHFIRDYYKPFVLFLAGTGLRWGEATALHWRDVNLWAATPTVRVVQAWKKSGGGGPVLAHPKSSKARRTVSMHQGLATALGQPGNGDELVFPGKLSGNHLWYARFSRSTWNPAVEKAMDKELCASLGLTPLTRRPTPHDLRHTHASWLIAAGQPLPYIQARLGHEKITTTVDVYGHLVPDAHERLAFAIEQTLDGAVGQTAIAAPEPEHSEYVIEEDDMIDAEVVEALPPLAIEPAKRTLPHEDRDAKVRSMRGQGMTMRAIADRMGMSTRTIQAVLRDAVEVTS
ncbi:tyrosine-type recombinase/integrase [Microbacterium trichothecenolyticum]|nr:tyrosine-type recombinase/integrase [Microbacterium trichothecenolyticum]